MKKYEILQDDEHTRGNLHRIRALIDYGNVDAGDLGGWIENESNLSQDGDCWVYDEAIVSEGAMVFNDAQVYAKVYGNAEVRVGAFVPGWNLV